jgi:hypothetical protein
MAIILPTPLPFKFFLHSKMKLNQIEPIHSQKIFVILPPTIQLWRSWLPVPDGGFQRPRKSIHQGKNLAARPQPKHQFEPATFE